jgi:hypothetical protein
MRHEDEDDSDLWEDPDHDPANKNGLIPALIPEDPEPKVWRPVDPELQVLGLKPLRETDWIVYPEAEYVRKSFFQRLAEHVARLKVLGDAERLGRCVRIDATVRGERSAVFWYSRQAYFAKWTPDTKEMP